MVDGCLCHCDEEMLNYAEFETTPNIATDQTTKLTKIKILLNLLHCFELT